MDNLTLVAKDTVVTFHYTLTDKDGQVLDSSQGQEPLVYLHGYSQIVRGLESALLGKSAGAAFKVTVDPAEGYGERREEMVITLPRTQGNLPDDIEVGSEDVHSVRRRLHPRHVHAARRHAKRTGPDVLGGDVEPTE